MMRLLSIICESMIHSDLPEKLPDGFIAYNFDPMPSKFSATSLWCMQSDLEMPDYRVGDFGKVSPLFSPERGDFISKHHKTKIFANFFPGAWNPAYLDPTCRTSGGRTRPEPDNDHWIEFLKFLPNWDSQIEWVIYWGTMGHSEGFRDPSEEGVPPTLFKTCKRWLDLISVNVLPLVPPDVTVLMHSDHGSARKNRSVEVYHDGFLLSKKPVPHPLDWAGVRKLQREVLECG